MLTRASITERLKTASPTGEALAGDHALNPGMGVQGDLKAAAVLVALVDRPDGLTVLLTRRTDDLEHHPGQISFPGGHVDAGDKDATAAALRELEEETGIAPTHVTVAGMLATYVTRTGFSIEPVIGFLDPGFTLAPDPKEVAEVFEVPLAFLMDPANHQRMSREFEGKMRYYYAMPYGDYYIWGATAGMLRNLHAVLTGEPVA